MASLSMIIYLGALIWPISMPSAGRVCLPQPVLARHRWRQGCRIKSWTVRAQRDSVHGTGYRSPSAVCLLAKEQRGLEGHARRLLGRSPARSRHAIDFPRKFYFDLVDPENSGWARGMPSGRQCCGESIAVDFVGAAVAEYAIAARYPAICKMHDAGAFALRSPEPGSISTISEHGKTLT